MQGQMKERKPYKCHHCSKAFANSSYLNQHTRIHAGIKPYNCDMCQRKFTQLSHLQQHLRTHTGDKPYKCNNVGCAKAFTQLSSLQSHSRCHNTNKPFKCNSCYKCFEDEKSLREHIPKHKNSKQSKTHICFLCGKSYTQEIYLTRHIMKHKTAPANASSCGSTLNDLFPPFPTSFHPADPNQEVLLHRVQSASSIVTTPENLINDPRQKLNSPPQLPFSIPSFSSDNYMPVDVVADYETCDNVFDRLNPTPASLPEISGSMQHIHTQHVHCTIPPVGIGGGSALLFSKTLLPPDSDGLSTNKFYPFHNHPYNEKGPVLQHDPSPPTFTQVQSVVSNSNPYHSLFPFYEQLLSANTNPFLESLPLPPLPNLSSTSSHLSNLKNSNYGIQLARNDDYSLENSITAQQERIFPSAYVCHTNFQGTTNCVNKTAHSSNSGNIRNRKYYS